MKKSSQCSSHHSQSVQWEFGDGRCVCKISSTVAKTRRQLKCLPTDEQIKEVWYRKRNIFSPKKEGHPGVPWWLRGLQIQHCHFSGLSSGHHGALMLGLLGTSTGHERGQKKKDRKKEILKYVNTGLDAGDIRLSEINQTQDKYYMLHDTIYTRNLK